MSFPYADDTVEKLIDLFELLAVTKPEALLYFIHRGLLHYRRKLLETDEHARDYLFPSEEKVGQVDFSTGVYSIEYERTRTDARQAIRSFETIKDVPPILRGLRLSSLQRRAYKSLLARLRQRGMSADNQLSVLAAIRVLEKRELADPLLPRLIEHELTAPYVYRTLIVPVAPLPHILSSDVNIQGELDGVAFTARVTAAEPATLTTRSAEGRITLATVTLGDSFTVSVNGNDYAVTAGVDDTPTTILEQLRDAIIAGVEPGVVAELKVGGGASILVLTGEDYTASVTSSSGQLSLVNGFDFANELPTSTTASAVSYSVAAQIGSLGSMTMQTSDTYGVEIYDDTPSVFHTSDAYVGCLVRFQILTPPPIRKLWLRVISRRDVSGQIRLGVVPWSGGAVELPDTWPDDSTWSGEGAFLYHDSRLMVRRDGVTDFYDPELEPDLGPGETYATYLADLIVGATAIIGDKVQISASESLLVLGSGETPAGGPFEFTPQSDSLEDPELTLELSTQPNVSEMFTFTEEFKELPDLVAELNSSALPLSAAIDGNKVVITHDELGPFYIDVLTGNDTLGLAVTRVWGEYSEFVNTDGVFRLQTERETIGTVMRTSDGVYHFTGAPTVDTTVYLGGFGYRKYLAGSDELDFPIPIDVTFTLQAVDDFWSLRGGSISILSGSPELALEEGEYSGGIIDAAEDFYVDDVYHDGVYLHRYTVDGWYPPLTDKTVLVTSVAAGGIYTAEVNGTAYSYTAAVGDDEKIILAGLRDEIQAGGEPNLELQLRELTAGFGLRLSGDFVVAVRGTGGAGLRIAPIITTRHYVAYLLSIADLVDKRYDDILLSALRGERVSQLPDISWWEDWDPAEVDFVDQAGLSYLEALEDAGLSYIVDLLTSGLVSAAYSELTNGSRSTSQRFRKLLARRMTSEQSGNISIDRSTYIPNESELPHSEVPGNDSSDFDEVY